MRAARGRSDRPAARAQAPAWARSPGWCRSRTSTCLLEVAGLLRRTHPGVEVVIVGDGPERDRLESPRLGLWVWPGWCASPDAGTTSARSGRIGRLHGHLDLRGRSVDGGAGGDGRGLAGGDDRGRRGGRGGEGRRDRLRGDARPGAGRARRCAGRARRRPVGRPGSCAPAWAPPARGGCAISSRWSGRLQATLRAYERCLAARGALL